MSRVLRIAFLLLLACSGLVPRAQGQAAGGATFTFPYRPAPSGAKDFTIDARTGATTGARGYKKSDRVRIVLFNKNPFRFDYRVIIEEKDVTETAITSFLGLLKLPEGLV